MARITNGAKTGTVPDDKLQQYLDNGWTIVKVDEVMITDGKKRGRIPREQLKDYEANGWKLVVSGSGEAEPFSTDVNEDEELARWDGEDAEDDDTSTVGETVYDLGTGLMKGMTFGFDDVVAGLGARAGDFTQKMIDNDDGIAANWRRSGDAYDEGVKERRAEVQASKDRSPIATTVGEIGGVLLTAPLGAAGRGASTGVRVARGAGTGSLAALGFGDADTLEDAAVDAGVGAVGGAALAGLVPLIPGVAGRVVGKVTEKVKGEKVQGAVNALVDAAEANPLPRAAAAAVTGGKSEAGLALAKMAQTPKPAPAASSLPEWMQTGAGFLDDAADDVLAAMSPAERAAELEARKKALEALAAL